MFQKRNEAGRHRDQLLGRYVHVIHARRFNVNEVAFAAANDAVGGELAVFLDGRVGLRDDEGFLAVGSQIVQMRADLAVLGLAIRGFQEAEVVDAGEGGQRGDQADVGTFRRFHGANAAIMGGMHVPHLEAGAVAREATRPQGGQTALVG